MGAHPVRFYEGCLRRYLLMSPDPPLRARWCFNQRKDVLVRIVEVRQCSAPELLFRRPFEVHTFFAQSIICRVKVLKETPAKRPTNSLNSAPPGSTRSTS